MAFLKIRAGKVGLRRNSSKSKSKEPTRKARGIVYLVKSVLDNGDTVFKIGITTRNGIIERLMENMMALFQALRYIPRTTVKKFSKTEYYTEVEAYLHRVYKDKQYKWAKAFNGYSEYYMVDEKELVAMYEKVMKDPLDYIQPSKGAIEKQKVVKERQVEVSVNDIVPEMIG